MRSWLVAVTLSALVAPAGVAAQTTSETPVSAAPRFATRLSVKSATLLSRAPDARWLFPDRQTTTAFWRARIEPIWRPDARWTIDAAYEHRARLFSSAGASLSGGVLPSAADAPYRLTPLDWRIQTGAHGAWHHEIDRAAVQWRGAATEITAGRQALGWGRGVLFSALDVFAPFSPLEADREWRRGVDALRADVRLGDRASVELVGAFGTRPSSSVYAARVRGYNAQADIEVVGGRRARDAFAGVSTSLAVHGAELHGETGVFRTPAVPGSAYFGSQRTIAKIVAGASYRVAIGSGLFVEGEYHYTGFGATTARDTVALVTDAEFARRYLRGDTQILSRHALAAIASYEWSPLVAGGAQWIQNPVDGSGLLAPSLTVTPGDRWSVLISAYVPYGRAPDATTIRSEYGLTSLSLFAQLHLYR